MDVSYINPFIIACREVVDTMIHVPVSLGRPHLKDPSQRTFKVAAMVRLSGAVQGVVAFGFSEPVALALVGGLTGTRSEELDADVLDGLGEIANMVVGNAKKNLPGGLTQISPPTIIKHGEAVPAPPGLPVMIVPFDTGAGRFSIEVSIRVAAKAA